MRFLRKEFRKARLVFPLSLCYTGFTSEKGCPRMKKALSLLCSLLLLLAPAASLASGVWYSFTEKNVPEDLGYLV